MTKPKPNNRNLGVMLLLASITLFGLLAAIVNSNSGGPFRYGIGLGVALCGAIALATYSILVIRKGVKS